jgi:hypothetical protein
VQGAGCRGQGAGGRGQGEAPWCVVGSLAPFDVRESCGIDRFFYTRILPEQAHSSEQQSYKFSAFSVLSVDKNDCSCHVTLIVFMLKL